MTMRAPVRPDLSNARLPDAATRSPKPKRDDQTRLNWPRDSGGSRPLR